MPICDAFVSTTTIGYRLNSELWWTSVVEGDHRGVAFRFGQRVEAQRARLEERREALSPGRDPSPLTSDRRLRVVLDVAPYHTRPVGRVEPGNQVERHVDAGGNPRGGDHEPVVDEPLFATHLYPLA